ASIDLDPHQGTLTRYVENRKAFSESKGIRLPIPEHYCFSGSDADSVTAAENEDKERLDRLGEQLAEVHDYVVIDCPGSDTFLARHALSIADTLITPINDSFIDMDLLAKVGGNPPRVLGPSTYSQIVWEQKVQRAQRNRQSIDWIVMRNRFAQQAQCRRCAREARPAHRLPPDRRLQRARHLPPALPPGAHRARPARRGHRRAAQPLAHRGAQRDPQPARRGARRARDAAA